MLCFFFFCLIDQRVKTGSGFDGAIETFRDSMGIVVSCIILSHYRREDYRRRRLPCLIWGGVSAVGGIGALILGWDRVNYRSQWIVLILGVVLFGFALLHTFCAVVLDKRKPALQKGLFGLWTAMMLYMLFSRSHYTWPLFYLALFGCFYLTDYDRDEQGDLFEGICDGLILAFFILQGLAFVFRPFDNYDRRYVGFYNNCNQNALFYLEVLTAVLAKLLLAYRRRASKWLRLYYWLGIGTLLSFLFLTIGRTAWLLAFLMCILFLVLLDHFGYGRKWVRNGLCMILCAVLTFPLCFGAARYFPPLFHHPIWFWGEWSEDKVHSWDPWNSPKFVDMDEFLEAALGRITGMAERLWGDSSLAITARAAEGSQADETLPETALQEIQADGTLQETAPAETQTDETLPTVQDPRELTAVLTPEEGENSVLVRSTIYRYYFHRLNLLGQPYEEQGFQLTRYYWIGHAHNIFLQFGTDFGIPVMLALLATGVWCGRIYWRRIWREKSIGDAAFLLFASIPLLFGMLEYSWGVGSITMTMMFVAWKGAFSSGSICISGDNML